jgi:O-antigen/teichoic acid export membrane protein
VLRQLMGVFTNQVGMAILGAIGAIFSTRLLGPEQRGVVVVALLMAGVISVLAHMGLPYALTYNVSRATDARDSALGESMSVALRMTPLILALMLALYAVVYWLGHGTALRGVSPVLALSSVLLCVLYFAHKVVTSTFLGLHDFRWRNIVNIAQPAFMVAGLLIYWLLRLPLTPMVVLWVYIGSTAFTVAIGARRIAHAYRPKFCRRLPPEWKRDYVHYGLKFYLALVAQALNYRLDTLLINAMLGNAMVGLYSTGVTVAELLLFVPSAVIQVFYPQVAAVTKERRERVTLLTLGASLYLVFVGGIVLGVALPWLVPLLYGRAFTGSIPAAFWLIPGMLALTVVNILNHAVAGFGRPEYATYTTFIGLMATVVLDLWLIPRYGIVGAAWASTLAYGLSALVILHLYLRLGRAGAREMACGLVREPAIWVRERWQRRSMALSSR